MPPPGASLVSACRRSTATASSSLPPDPRRPGPPCSAPSWGLLGVGLPPLHGYDASAALPVRPPAPWLLLLCPLLGPLALTPPQPPVPPPGAPSPQRLPGRPETEFSALHHSTSLQPSKCVEAHDCRIVPSVRSLQLLPPRHLSWHLLSCELVPFHTDQSLPTALKLSRLAPHVAHVVLRPAGVPRLVDSASQCSRLEPSKFVPQLPLSRHLSSRLALLWGQSHLLR